MKYITLVGCGFLGSVFTTEFTKRMYAAKVQLDWRFIDPDIVAMRNVCNQNFSVKDVDRKKVDVMADIVDSHDYNEVEAIPDKLTDANANELLGEADLVICAVDNQKARDAVWVHAVGAKSPTLFLGLSETGTGEVSWSGFEGYDTLSLSPLSRPADWKEAPAKVFPPCELASNRIHGLILGHRAALAASVFLGQDIEGNFGPQQRTPGLMTTWLYDGFGVCKLINQKEASE